ncbi:MAG: response regulator transcription factor [Oscillospiraceae bacterium]|nr:response regulator transcription factor [Oscillospiraceae bacterium]
MHFVIYDDQPDAAASLRSMLLPLFPSPVQVDCASTLAQAQTLIGAQTDVVFQDIQLEHSQNGIDFARKLHQLFPRLKFVFITAFSEYYEEIFTVDPIAFIQKPFRQEGVRLCVEQLERHLHEQQIIVSPTKGHIQTLALSDVFYIENSDRRLLLRTADDAVKYTLRMRMSDIEPQLPVSFVRCHHSFCVNLEQVTELRRFFFILKNGREIPVSSRRFAQAREQYLTFLGSQL